MPDDATALLKESPALEAAWQGMEVVACTIRSWRAELHLEARGGSQRRGPRKVTLDLPYPFPLHSGAMTTSVEYGDGRSASLLAVTALLGRTLTALRLFEAGRLEVEFSGGERIVSDPHPQFEWWAIRSPGFLHLHSLPGGGVAVWRIDEASQQADALVTHFQRVLAVVRYQEGELRAGGSPEQAEALHPLAQRLEALIAALERDDLPRHGGEGDLGLIATLVGSSVPGDERNQHLLRALREAEEYYRSQWVGQGARYGLAMQESG